MTVVVLPEVRFYLKNLIPILYEKGYFGFKESARTYVYELYNDVQMYLPTCSHKPAPKYFDRYGKGMKYAVFRKSRHTHWYVFFTTYRKNGQLFYLIRYIANNHLIAQYL